MAEPEMVKLEADFGPGGAPTEPPPSDYDAAVGKLREAQVQLGNPPDGLRFQRPAPSATKATWVAWSDKVREAAGIAWQYIDDAVPLLPKGDGAPVGPPAQPPAAEFVSPLANGGVLGRTKWLAGSTGCDIFVRRGTPIRAPADCVVEEVIGGQGMTGGDELILSLPDKSWAWRYRHTAATKPVGYHAKQGEQVGVANDDSLDQLGAIPNWAQQQAGGPFPDGWQHLDLSVNRGTDQFNPQGGGGGNVDAYTWLMATGYAGTVLGRTPGPPDAGRGLSVQEAVEFLTPAGRR